MNRKNIIVIGASSGGLEALKRLFSGLTNGIDAAIFIVWHMPPDVMGFLPRVLGKLTAMTTENAIDNEPIVFNRVYVAPPDRHMMIESGRVRVVRGPKENRFRPAIDPLFRSAAYTYGGRVIGIILSGALDDGSAGLWAVKKFGGTTIVQDPAESDVPGMPESALRLVRDVDYKITAREMAGTLGNLVLEPALGNHDPGTRQRDKTGSELKIAMMEERIGKKPMGKLTPYTCPECHGVLLQFKENGRERFRCHTGHAFSANGLLADLTEGVEDSLWTTVRTIEESVLLLSHMSKHLEKTDPGAAAEFQAKAEEAKRRSEIVRKALNNHEGLNVERVLEAVET